MMPRGEVALIVALVGLTSKIVTPPTYAIVVFMTAVTTLLAPPVLRYLYRDTVREAAAAGVVSAPPPVSEPETSPALPDHEY
jgi:Kef-type K+ transport system membrane component KefB